MDMPLQAEYVDESKEGHKEWQQKWVRCCVQQMWDVAEK
jgi:hypothetical protein